MKFAPFLPALWDYLLLKHFSIFVTLVACSIFNRVETVMADESLEPKSTSPEVAEINRLIRAGWEARTIQPAARCTDREFARRVYLDLVGRPPRLSELNTFLADGRGQKRQLLVDNLLASEDYVQHFADLFDVLLMGRGSEGKYAQRRQHGWRAYLERAFRENRDWNQVSQEVLLGRPTDDLTTGAAWFLYERKDRHQELAEAIAPAFFGIRIECAQCHDHMIADEIEQAHYWGLVAFFNRGKNANTPNGPRVVESAIGGFSEYADITGSSSPNNLTFFGAKEVDEPRPQNGAEPKDSADLYVMATRKGEPRIPRFSRRQLFVEQVFAGHDLPPRAMVNKLWAILFGRGIVHPYDQMDSAHPPSHPELLDLLSQKFTSSGYDVRELVRCMVLSEAYQLSSSRPERSADPASFAWYLPRPLIAEQLARSVQITIRGKFQNDSSLVSLYRQQFPEVLPREIQATIGDALFLSNSPQLNEFIRNSSHEHHLVPRLEQLPSHRERVEQMFLTIFGRLPDTDESERVVAFLDERNDRLREALQLTVWSLITSSEFRFNH